MKLDKVFMIKLKKYSNNNLMWLMKFEKSMPNGLCATLGLGC